MSDVRWKEKDKSLSDFVSGDENPLLWEGQLLELYIVLGNPGSWESGFLFFTSELSLDQYTYVILIGIVSIALTGWIL